MTTRRSFIKSVSALSAGVAATGINPLLAEQPPPAESSLTNRKIYLFSKHLQWLDYEEMAETAKKSGYDGLDLTVRPKGHVLPENVREDLPRAIQAIRQNGLLGDRMTTAITSADDPLTLDILETASELGVTHYRMGWFGYDPSFSIERNIELKREEFKKLAALNKRYGIQASYQNHAGEMVGAPVWDIALMLADVDPDYVGMRYDVRHATVEGGQSWPLGMKYLSGRINSFDIKDFFWKEIDGKWVPFNVQLGAGMVDFDRYVKLIREHKIQGDFTIHLEYPIGGAEHGATSLTTSPEVVLSAMKHDLAELRRLISKA